MEYERRWLTPVGLAVIGLVVVANAAGTVGLGTSGDALVVTVGVALYAVSALLFLLWYDAPTAVVVLLLLAMAVASALTHHGDPTGTGGIGLYLGVAFAPLRLAVRTAAAVSAFGVLVFDTHLALAAENPWVFILVVDAGAALFFLLGTLLRREQEQRRRVAQLLADLEASREAERESAALAERSRLAREMHDVLAHTLSGLVLHLDGARLLSGRSGADPRLTETIARAQELARAGLDEAREAIAALRDGSLPGPELLPALVAEHMEATGQRCRLVTEGRPVDMPPEARLAVYRTAQEALSNVRKHAARADAEVRLSWGVGSVDLVVVDSGGAVGKPVPGHGHGLQGMRERAELIGGRLETGATGEGFRVHLCLPLVREGVR